MSMHRSTCAMILVLADMVNICDSLHVSWDTIIQVVPTDVDDRWTNPTATPCHPLIIPLLVGLTGKVRNPNTRATFPVRLLLLIHTSHQNPFHHPRQTTQACMLGTSHSIPMLWESCMGYGYMYTYALCYDTRYNIHAQHSLIKTIIHECICQIASTTRPTRNC